MGALYREHCHATELEAASMMCGTEFPRTESDGQGGIRSFSCSVAVDGQLTVVATAGGASAPTSSTAVPVSFVPCDPNAHYAEIGWYFAAFIAAAALIAVVHVIFRPFRENQ